MDICVLVRVHSRMADLEVCLRAIRHRWFRHRYHVVLLSSGLADGCAVPDGVRAVCDDVAGLVDNPGHVAGSSRLLRAGIGRVPERCRYVVLLEADTWIHDDVVLDRYVRRLEASGAVWASATWIESGGRRPTTGGGAG